MCELEGKLDLYSIEWVYGWHWCDWVVIGWLERNSDGEICTAEVYSDGYVCEAVDINKEVLDV